MRKLEELKLAELKGLTRCGKQEGKCRLLILIFAILGVIAAIGAIAFAIARFYRVSDEFDFDDFDDEDCDCDENGCYYTDDEDFEK